MTSVTSWSDASFSNANLLVHSFSANLSIHSPSMERKPMGKRSDNRTDLLPGTLDMLILKTLTRAPQHGYGIAHAILQMSGEELLVEEGSLYPALQRLEMQGWVESEWRM